MGGSDTDSTLDFMYRTPLGLEKIGQNEDEQKRENDPRQPNLNCLKNAPSMGRYTEGLEINHKPLGIEVRKVRCARCGEWGHTSGDRECKMKDVNPNDGLRQQLEDPINSMYMRPTQLEGNLQLKESIRRELDPHANDKDLLPLGPDDEEDPEQEFLNSLSRKDKKKLLKHLKREKRKKHKKKKSKKRKHSNSSDSSEDEPRKTKKQKK